MQHNLIQEKKKQHTKPEHNDFLFSLCTHQHQVRWVFFVFHFQITFNYYFEINFCFCSFTCHRCMFVIFFCWVGSAFYRFTLTNDNFFFFFSSQRCWTLHSVKTMDDNRVCNKQSVRLILHISSNKNNTKCRWHKWHIDCFVFRCRYDRSRSGQSKFRYTKYKWLCWTFRSKWFSIHNQIVSLNCCEFLIFLVENIFFFFVRFLFLLFSLI